MSVEGISIGAPGGAGEPKPTKGISELGDAKQSDVTKFNEGMTAEGPAALGSSGGVAGPFDAQSTRITDSANVGKPSLGDAIIKDAGNMLKMGRNQEQKMLTKLESVKENGWSPSDAMEFQYMAGEMQLLTEVASRVSKNITTAVQTMVRNQ